MRPSTRVSSPAVILLALAAAACLDTAAPLLDQPRSIAAVVVQPAQANVHLDQHLSLSALALDPSGEQVSGQQVVWSSEDTSIATVSPTGEVTPRRLGSATILASAGATSGSAQLTVVPPAVATVDLSPTRATIAEGDTLHFTAVPRSAAGDSLGDRPVAWSTGDAGVATVSASGRVTGVHAGSTTLTATAEGVTATAAITVEVPTVATVTIAPTSVSLLAGQSSQLTATVKDSRGQSLTDRTIAWSSTNTAVATVSAAGLVSGVAEGSTTIYATSERKKDSVRVSVSRAPVASVSVTPSSATIEAGKSAQLTATPEDAGGKPLAGRIVSWTTSSAAVATVSSTGMVTAVAAGSATVTATCEGKSGAASVSVVVVQPTVASVSVTPASDTVLAGSTTQLAATPKDASGSALSGRTIAWSSSDTAVATVSSAGLVRGVAPGRATITATIDGKSGSASVLVMAPPVASVDVSPSSASIVTGATVQLSAATRDASGATLTGRAVSWASSNSAVATVSSGGLVTAVAAGSATITATSEGKSGMASIVVTEPPPPTDAHSGWFVSPTGTSGASGAATSPWSLAFALGGANGKIQPGDTVWLRGG
ncbi:MAG TPA: Ig-like domain-containing protein, partial [Gemmatimonadaceae bacterium]